MASSVSGRGEQPPADSLGKISGVLVHVKMNRATSSAERQKHMLSIADALERMVKLGGLPELDKEEYLEMYNEFQKLITINSDPSEESVNRRVEQATKSIRQSLHLPIEEEPEAAYGPPPKRSKKEVRFAELPERTRPAPPEADSFSVLSQVLLEKNQALSYQTKIHTILVALNHYVSTHRITRQKQREILNFVNSLPTQIKRRAKVEPLAWPPPDHRETGTPSLKAKIHTEYTQLMQKLSPNTK